MHVLTLEYFNFKRENELKRLLSTFIATAITAVEWLLEEIKSFHIWIIMIIRLRARSISDHIPTSSAH